MIRFHFAVIPQTFEKSLPARRFLAGILSISKEGHRVNDDVLDWAGPIRMAAWTPPAEEGLCRWDLTMDSAISYPDARPEDLLDRARAGDPAARGRLLELYRNYLRLM